MVRLRASSRASSRSAGRRVPGGSRPRSMARARAAASCSLSGSAPSAQGPMSSTSAAAETIDCLFSPLVVDWLLDWSLMRVMMREINSPMSRRRIDIDAIGPERKGERHDVRSGRGRPRCGRHLHHPAASPSRRRRSASASTPVPASTTATVVPGSYRRANRCNSRADGRPRPNSRGRFVSWARGALSRSRRLASPLSSRACRPGRTPGPRVNRHHRASGASASRRRDPAAPGRGACRGSR